MKTLTIGGAAHAPDGSGYYRIYLPFTHLGNNSRHMVGVVPPDAPAALGPGDVEGLDVLVLQRPAGRAGTRMLERLVGRVKLVYEVDDDMLQVDPSGLPHLHDEQFRETVRRCVRLCDMVTVSNPYLAETLRPFNDNIVILPNHIKAGLLTLARPRHDGLVIGWAGGTTHLVDMVTAADPLREVLEANPDVDMHFMGVDFSPLLKRQCRWSSWKRDVGEYYKGIDFDIAVAPSADIPFNRSKTPLRALEMGALGVPVVASNRAPYADYIIDGKTGFLVSTDDEWRTRLTDLIHDADMRAEMGAAAKEQASGWTIEEGWQLWESCYEGAAG